MAETARDKVVIIGAGMGGLSAAMRLAHAGLDVTVVEAHDAPGGKMRTVDSIAGPVDAGPTVMTMRWVFDQLFEDVGEALDDHVRLTPATVLARHWWRDGSTLDLFADPEASAQAVRDFTGPKEEQAFRRFCSSAASLFEAFEKPVMLAEAPEFVRLAAQVLRNPRLIPAMAPHKSLMGTLENCFVDPRLRQLFGRYATYVGGSPFRSPAVLGLIWHAEAQGVWSVGGGMHALARAMERVAMVQGAKVHYLTRAEGIDVENGRAVAVHLSDGSRLPADMVLFNGDPAALYRGYLGAAGRKAVARPAVTPRSLSAAVMSFAARPSGPELSHHNVFFAGDSWNEFGPIDQGRLPDDPTLYVCAQDRGGGVIPTGPERFEIIMNAPPGLADSEKERETCRTRIFRRLESFGLSFDPEPGDASLTTPAQFDAMFPASDGSLYGRSPHGLMAAFRRPTARTRIPGLYLAGGGTHPGAGVPMSTLSGGHAAAAMLTDRTSTSRSRRMATPGGTSMGSATMASAPSRSSAS